MRSSAVPNLLAGNVHAALKTRLQETSLEQPQGGGQEPDIIPVAPLSRSTACAFFTCSSVFLRITVVVDMIRCKFNDQPRWLHQVLANASNELSRHCMAAGYGSMNASPEDDHEHC